MRSFDEVEEVARFREVWASQIMNAAEEEKMN